MTELYNEHIGMTSDEYVDKNKKLAHFVAQKYKDRMDYEDAVQLAFIGLTKAYNGYDGRFGTRHTTYAVPKMHGEIQRFLRDNNTSVKFPRVFQEIWNAVSRKGLEEEPYEKISEETGFELKFVKRAMPYYGKNKPVSMNQSKYDNSHSDDSEATIGDTIKSTQDYSSVFVNDFLSTLDERTQLILDMTMNKGMTQREIGKEIGVSQVQVSRLIKKVAPLWEEYAS